MIGNIAAIAAGASIGAVARWLIGLALNPLHPLLPMGTLAVNCIGGYCIGLAVSIFAFLPDSAPVWRLFVFTGVLGSFTTFSAFSYEAVALLQQQRLFAAFTLVVLHVAGALTATFLG
ncbi:fluoride efflux transporter CrcB, partial [Desulfovibrio sp. OttesenSCG-928-I05]|nr:fluoride efflux transporter CrcB [Desulfovibrio sp. OttesenSCG-928-I05]